LTMLDKIYGERGCDAERAELRRAEFDAPLVGAPDYARRSSRWLEEARPEDAARVATDGLALSPKNAPLLFNYALGTALCGDPERAIDALARLISGETEIVETGAYLRATLLEQLGRRAEALAVLEATFGDEPVQEDACLMRARLLAALGHGERAEAALRHAMGTGRKRIGVELASMMLREGRYDDARNVAETALTPA
ncbi:MAG: hypothetical protein JOY59_08080, partial [Candidatus Eremiobacteraeota bacterium]|nr:hypothetical protein [Candidatus Eremiobacteraeota bacterium]